MAVGDEVLGPPVLGAMVGTPAAWASWMVWQKVSNSPGWMKMSKVARVWASWVPVWGTEEAGGGEEFAEA